MRVYGRMFDETVVQKLRKGFRIHDVQYGPYQVPPYLAHVVV